MNSCSDKKEAMVLTRNLVHCSGDNKRIQK